MASSYGTDADKTALRAGYLAARRQLPADLKAESDRAIRTSLFAFDIFNQAPLVLTYVSRGAEVDTSAIVEHVLAQGRAVGAPVVDQTTKELAFYRIEGAGQLVAGYKGILEPDTRVCARIDAAELFGSVCLVPGLVFDAQGHRIGYGGGCYDRFLWHYPGDKIALARIMQISSNPLPIDGFDVPVDFIATEHRVWACR